MKLPFILLAIIALVGLVSSSFEEDNDFADFENFDENDKTEPEMEEAIDQDPKPAVDKVKLEPEATNNDEFIDDDSDGIVDIEEEFDIFTDQDEFENFGTDQVDAPDTSKKTSEPKLTIAKVPLHFSKNWDSYWIEMIFLLGLFVYFLNYAMGKNKNLKVVNTWLTTHRTFLEENFALVGDDGKKETDSSQPVGFIKESDNVYSLWCSGRICCEGMLVELKLIKRQDLVSIVAGFVKKTQDQVQIKVEMSKDSMDSFVMAVCSKKSATRMFKDMNDLKQFCISVAKPDEKYGLPLGYSLLSEVPEASAAILDSRLIAMLNKYYHIIDSIHISDQFSGGNPETDGQPQLKQPETKKMLILTYFVPEKTDIEEMRPILQLVIYLIDKLKRYKLSREGKMKSEKNRLRVEEEFLKNTHHQRAEAASLKREEKRKAEKEKIMNEENTEKQIRLEKKMKRKDAKKAMPKMKSMSIHL